jgi:hypothetical protein
MAVLLEEAPFARTPISTKGHKNGQFRRLRRGIDWVREPCVAATTLNDIMAITPKAIIIGQAPVRPVHEDRAKEQNSRDERVCILQGH